MTRRPQCIQDAYIAFSWLFPIEETDSIRISHSQRNKFDVSFCEVLFFQTVDSSFPIFLETEKEYKLVCYEA